MYSRSFLSAISPVPQHTCSSQEQRLLSFNVKPAVCVLLHLQAVVRRYAQTNPATQPPAKSCAQAAKESNLLLHSASTRLLMMALPAAHLTACVPQAPQVSAVLEAARQQLSSACQCLVIPARPLPATRSPVSARSATQQTAQTARLQETCVRLAYVFKAPAAPHSRTARSRPARARRRSATPATATAKLVQQTTA
jgi:hypothetical protein